MTKQSSGTSRFGSCCFLLIFLVVTFVGCGDQGPKFFPVEGKVIFSKDSSAARFGSIEFRSDSQPPVIARGKIQSDGSFRLASNGRKGTVAGTHSVVIIQVTGSHRGIREKIVHDHGHDAAPKYSDHRTSDLKVEVRPDSFKDLVLEIDSK